MLTERLNKRIAEKAELEAQLAVEENKKITLTEAQILAFLDYVCEMPADDVNKRRAIINIFVHSIYLYDDHFTLIINASKKPLSIDNIPLDDIETAFEGETGASEGCSSLGTPAPPKIRLIVLIREYLKLSTFSFCKNACGTRLFGKATLWNSFIVGFMQVFCSSPTIHSVPKTKPSPTQKCRKRLEIKGFRGQLLTLEALFMFIRLWDSSVQTLGSDVAQESCGVRILE